MKRLYFGILAGVLLMASTVLAQTSTVDVLYLKNGSVIRGQVTSMTTKVVKIQTADGSLFVYPMKAVAKMEKITTGSAALEDSTSDESMQPVSTELVQPIAVPEPETKPVKQGVHFGIRGAIFLNIAIWDQLAKGAYLAQEPDSKLGWEFGGSLHQESLLVTICSLDSAYPLHQTSGRIRRRSSVTMLQHRSA